MCGRSNRRENAGGGSRLKSRETGELFLATALRLAQEAATAVMKLRDRPLAQKRKEDRTLVTEADLCADKILREGLAEAFPEHGVISEEAGYLGPAGAEYIWLVDPLDGTKAYVQGIPGFAVMVGLLKAGRPCLGVVVDPLGGRVYEAVRGEGAYLTQGGERSELKVSTRERWEEMPVVVSTGFPADLEQRLRATLNGPWCPPINSVGIKVGMVIRQEADIYISHHSVHYWDTCAPQVILEEAGGVLTRLDGRPLAYDLISPFSHESLTLASNGTRHEELVTLLKPIF